VIILPFGYQSVQSESYLVKGAMQAAVVLQQGRGPLHAAVISGVVSSSCGGPLLCCLGLGRVDTVA
jgi:hypothetical protein